MEIEKKLELLEIQIAELRGDVRQSVTNTRRLINFFENGISLVEQQREPAVIVGLGVTTPN